MRFVTPEVVRIELKDGPNGEKNWIEIYKELSKGDDAAMRASGLKRMSQGQDEKTTEIGVDWKSLSLGRVCAYLTDWSAKDARGKDMKCTPSAIAELATEDFDEIDEAIKAHIKRLEDEKKASAGASQPVTTS